MDKKKKKYYTIGKEGRVIPQEQVTLDAIREGRIWVHPQISRISGMCFGAGKGRIVRVWPPLLDYEKNDKGEIGKMIKEIIKNYKEEK